MYINRFSCSFEDHFFLQHFSPCLVTIDNVIVILRLCMLIVTKISNIIQNVILTFVVSYCLLVVPSYLYLIFNFQLTTEK